MTIPVSQHDLVPGLKIDKRWWNFLNTLANSAITSEQVSALIAAAIEGIEQPDIRINSTSTIRVTGNATDGFAISFAGTTDQVPEGETNLYFTDARAQAAVRPVLPVVTGEIDAGQPVFVYAEDGSLIYTEI